MILFEKLGSKHFQALLCSSLTVVLSHAPAGFWPKINACPKHSFCTNLISQNIAMSFCIALLHYACKSITLKAPICAVALNRSLYTA